MNSKLVLIALFGFMLLFGCMGISSTRSSGSLATGITGSFLTSSPGASYDYPVDQKSYESAVPIAAVNDNFDGRLVAKEATVQVKVERGQLESKLAEAKALLGGKDAELLSIDYYERYGTKTYALSFRVKPQDFDPMLESLKALGEVKSVNLNIEDVTKQYTDLNLRIRNSQFELDRLYVLYNASESVADTLAVEKEITRVTSDLEIMQTEKLALETRVAKSLMNLEIYEQVAASEAREGEMSLQVKEGQLEAKLSALKQTLSSQGGDVASVNFNENDNEKYYYAVVRVDASKLDSFMDSLKSLGEVKYMNKNVDEKNRPEKSLVAVTMTEPKPAVQTALLLPLGDLLVVFLGAVSAGIAIAIGAVGFLLPVGLVVFVIYKIYRHFRPKADKPAKKN